MLDDSSNPWSQTRILPRRPYVRRCQPYLKNQENNFVWPPRTTSAIIRACTSSGTFGQLLACSSRASLTVTMLAPTGSQLFGPSTFSGSKPFRSLFACDERLLDLKTILVIIEAESCYSLEYFLLYAMHFSRSFFGWFVEPQFQQ